MEIKLYLESQLSEHWVKSSYVIAEFGKCVHVKLYQESR